MSRAAAFRRLFIVSAVPNRADREIAGGQRRADETRQFARSARVALVDGDMSKETFARWSGPRERFLRRER